MIKLYERDAFILFLFVSILVIHRLFDAMFVVFVAECIYKRKKWRIVCDMPLTAMRNNFQFSWCTHVQCAKNKNQKKKKKKKKSEQQHHHEQQQHQQQQQTMMEFKPDAYSQAISIKLK